MILITAPTGHIGQQVLNSLLDSGESIRVVVRDAARLSANARGRVEVVEGSHGDPEVIDRAFNGVESVFWLVPPNPTAESPFEAYVDFSRPAIEAFTRHGVARVVGISALGRGTPYAEHAGYVTATLELDDLIAGSGVDYRALTMPSFMDNILRQVVPIRDRGMFFGTISADRKNPTCATRDIAAAAARLLADHSWTGNGHVAVLGPEDLSFNDEAKIMSDVLGQEIRYQQIPTDALKAQMTERGMSDGMAQGMLDMLVAKDKGLDNAEPRTDESTTPTSFRQWCAELLRPAVQGKGQDNA